MSALSPANEHTATIEEVEAALLPLPQVELPLTHRFAPGIYLREISMPADTIVIGHEHKTEHFNIVLTGRALVLIDGETHTITAPCTFISKPGVRKTLYIIEDMRWQTVHPTEETDLEKLEALLIRKSDAFMEFQALTEAAALRKIATTQT